MSIESTSRFSEDQCCVMFRMIMKTVTNKGKVYILKLFVALMLPMVGFGFEKQ